MVVELEGRRPWRGLFGLALLGAVVVVIGCSVSDSAASGPSVEAPNVDVDEPASPVASPDDIEQITVELQTATEETAQAVTDAEALRAAVISSAEEEGWSDLRAVIRAGYEPMFGDESHFYNPGYLTDGRSFDPSAPEFLVVDGEGVVGVMFLADRPEPETDPPGAPFVKWHYHEWSSPLCLLESLVPVALPADGECPQDSVATRRSPAMAHVWLIDIEDPFATDMHAHEGH